MTYHHKAVKRDGQWLVVCEEIEDLKEEFGDDVQGACDRAAELNRLATNALIRRRTCELEKFDTGDQNDTG